MDNWIEDQLDIIGYFIDSTPDKELAAELEALFFEFYKTGEMDILDEMLDLIEE